MKVEIKNRFSGAVQFTAEIDAKFEHKGRPLQLGAAVKWGIKEGANLTEANLREADLREADLWGVNLTEANLRGANLRGADLWGVNLREADLRGADLREADLHGANLRGANLWGANLRGADLRGADLREASIIDAGVDKRGYTFRATYNPLNFDLNITAGCRTWVSVAEAQAHFCDDYDSDGDVTECLAKIQYIETVFEARQKEADAKAKPLAEVSA